MLARYRTLFPLLLVAALAAPSVATRPGSMTGFSPPALAHVQWIVGQPFEPADGKQITVLVFWTETQEKHIQTFDYARHLAESHVKLGVRVVLIAGDRLPANELQAAPRQGDAAGVVCGGGPARAGVQELRYPAGWLWLAARGAGRSGWPGWLRGRPWVADE
jgi:hypothetical protein